MNSTSTNISLSQVLSNQYTFNLAFDNSFSRIGNPPFSGTCNIVCNITSTDGLTNYATANISLFQLFYVGSASFTFNVPNGSYKLTTSLPSCSVTAGSLPVNVTWQNQVAAGNATTTGGLRIKQIQHYDPILGNYETIATYSYLTTDGKSSGFLGAIPLYNYPYQETVINGGTTTTNYTAISSDPVNDLNYTQGSTVGYSRVVVYKGSTTHNLGNTVYEFTNLQDANSNVIQPYFPYAPVIQPDWVIGLPKRISVFDSLGRLIRITRDTFTVTTNTYNTSDFTSLKLGKTSVTFNGDPNLSNTPYTEYYLGQTYTQQTGRSDLTSAVDSLFHPDGSIQVTYQTLQYDTNYNVIKTTTPYDKTRGLSLEKRFYYPYNYTLSSGAIKKLRDSSIINSVISNENWITGDVNPRMVSAQITDYQQLTKGHVKPLTGYTLQSNAPIPQSVIGSFNPSLLVRNSTYLVPQQNFVTYDTVGNLLEVKNDISGQSNSMIMDYFNQFLIAKISNATYGDVAYTSFESDGSGNWNISSTLRNSSSAITGKYCFDISKGNISKSGLNTSLTYVVSYWSPPGNNIAVSGASNQQMIAQQNGWNLYTQTISSSSSVTISGTIGLIDELRLYPKDANMTTSTYEPMIGSTSASDANSTVNYYLYDNLNRLKVVKDKDLNVLKKYEYDSITTSINTSPNWQYANSTQCETPLNGKVDSLIKDMNPFSDTYNATQWIFAHNNCAVCAPPCSGEGHKLVNCLCEIGTRVNTSVVQVKVNGVWIWRCTYHYEWSDCSISTNYTQDSSSPCTIRANCG